MKKLFGVLALVMTFLFAWVPIGEGLGFTAAASAQTAPTTTPLPAARRRTSSKRRRHPTTKKSKPVVHPRKGKRPRPNSGKPR